MKHINEGYSQINSFFDCYSLPLAALRLSSCIKAADSEKIWKGGKKNCPSDLILFMEKIEGLLEAAFRLVKAKKIKKKAILTNKDCELIFNNYGIYRGRYVDNNPSHLLPRNLDSNEFINPYEALQKLAEFYTEGEWKAFLNDILHHALSPHNFYEYGRMPIPSLVRIYILLNKLLEACYLIDARTTEENKE